MLINRPMHDFVKSMYVYIVTIDTNTLIFITCSKCKVYFGMNYINFCFLNV